jgi:hypothetical protein
MIGCLSLFAFAGLLTVVGIYMSSMLAYLAAMATVVGAYMSAMTAFFTVFFIMVFG